ncbi:MAG: type III-B CRISPR module RAMP protein Cmr4 [Acidobacteria bacterium]|nr:type III-B CRISPR module RAMP protein Cmr4 [Acidobacteriota bacterium]MCI0721014.1 type III-B CRISPR module RAMP protein Cmr4 [Acidobacteriota bacterium]
MSETTTKKTNEQRSKLLFLHAQTSLHPGSGTALGTVDLPIQRERHTQWPVIAGSTLKGILRDACRERAQHQYEPEHIEENGKRRVKRTRREVANEDDPMLVATFGPGKVDQTTGHAGALSLTDAHILAFPVRSLKGVFAWVTCPAVLERLHRDLKLGETDADGFTPPSAPAKDKALCQQGNPLLVDGNKLVLEEFEFERTGDAGAVTEWIAKHAVDDSFTCDRLKAHLVVLDDDDFTHFVRHATEVVARVGLDYERKTVKTGALFYEEFLPPETIFYSVVLTSASRREGDEKTAQDILEYLRDNIPPVLQIGGDETIGKGLCAVRLVGGKDGAK